MLEDFVAHPGAVAEAQTEHQGGELSFVYRHALKGYSAELDRSAVEALKENPKVKYVTPDHIDEAFSQNIPTGISRAFATANKSADIDEKDDVRVNADVAVIDTGIDYEHPDLNVVERTNCVPPKTFKEPDVEKCVDGTGKDNHYHGTHVAGTIGAIDNGEGVVGTAPGVRLWAVKVLTPESFGGASGSESWIIAGVDWVTAHSEQIEVANMSLGCACQEPALDEAIETSIEAGVVYVV
ncbi:MAG TPA: S8 family serine peptidase, partial [Solirubrobacterales bacterium]|nr:S8 family serine peptidase [Solirubrobacterales bacterium]